MQAARHQVVHQVVTRGDAVEYVVHQRLLVRERHLPIAEMGIFAGHFAGLFAVFGRTSCVCGRTIARDGKRRYVSRGERLIMPELPEVETVRRGLAPVMEGARFAHVEARRGDLRWPLPKDFAKRMTGATVDGLGRRAKYLIADLSTGDVLMMRSEERRVGKEG